jgi:hypothetical protein
MLLHGKNVRVYHGDSAREEGKEGEQDVTWTRLQRMHANNCKHGIMASELRGKVPAQVDPRFRLVLVNSVIGGFVEVAGDERSRFQANKGRKFERWPPTPARLIKRWRIACSPTIFPSGHPSKRQHHICALLNSCSIWCPYGSMVC